MMISYFLKLSFHYLSQYLSIHTFYIKCILPFRSVLDLLVASTWWARWRSTCWRRSCCTSWWTSWLASCVASPSSFKNKNKTISVLNSSSITKTPEKIREENSIVWYLQRLEIIYQRKNQGQFIFTWISSSFGTMIATIQDWNIQKLIVNKIKIDFLSIYSKFVK